MKLNEKYSYKSFKRQSFLDVDPAEFSDTEIIGTCFHQNEPYTRVFPDGIKNLTLTRCNIDNVEIPKGVTVNGGTNKHIRSMNNLEYYLIGRDGKAIEPRDKALFIKLGLSIDPRDIPAEPLAEPITHTNDPKRIEAAKIEALKSDETRLRRVLVDSGEIVERA